jgi:hypothetical protein
MTGASILTGPIEIGDKCGMESVCTKIRQERLQELGLFGKARLR